MTKTNANLTEECGCTPWDPRNPDQHCTLPKCYYAGWKRADNTSPIGGQLAWEDWHRRVYDKHREYNRG
jgi:hypothetical protein